MLLAYYMYLGNTMKRKKMQTQDVWNLLNTVPEFTSNKKCT